MLVDPGAPMLRSSILSVSARIYVDAITFYTIPVSSRRHRFVARLGAGYYTLRTFQANAGVQGNAGVVHLKESEVGFALRPIYLRLSQLRVVLTNHLITTHGAHGSIVD